MSTLVPERPDVERLRRLTRFIPKFRTYSETEKEFGEVSMDGGLYAQYPDLLDSFLDQLEEDGWLEGPYSGEEGKRHAKNPALIEQADLETLQRLLVYCSRGGRFCIGFWKRVVETGFLLGILRRLREIQHSLEDGPKME